MDWHDHFLGHFPFDAYPTSAFPTSEKWEFRCHIVWRVERRFSPEFTLCQNMGCLCYCSSNSRKCRFYVMSCFDDFRYICQYIEVRRMSAKNAGIWLAVQGLFALIRLTIWIADPNTEQQTETEMTMETSTPNLAEKQLGLISMSEDPHRYYFYMRKWAAEILQETTICLHKPFTLALSAYARRQISGTDLLAVLENAIQTWDMPEELFISWVNIHHHASQSLQDSLEQNRFSARVIMNREGECHILPFWSCADPRGDLRIRAFGNLSDETATVIHISSYFKSDDTTMKDQLIIGWPKSIETDENPLLVRAQSTVQKFSAELRDDYSDSSVAPLPGSAIRAHAIKMMDAMWGSLKQIFKAAASQHSQQLPELFLDEEEAEKLEYPGAPAKSRSSVPEPSDIVRRRHSR